MAVQNAVRCRQIGENDVAAVAALLARGFPSRPLRYWTRGLAILGRRPVPDGYPRFGFMLEHEGRPVGAILMIAQRISHDGEPYVRCNLASWYVDPLYRSYAAMLSLVPLRYKAATLLNVSAAPNTWPTIEAQGFERYGAGQALAVPMVARGTPGCSVRPYRPGDAPALPEAALLDEHVGTGCLAYLGQDGADLVPFVFLPVRARQGRLPFPGLQLVFCRHIGDLTRFAGPLGRMLLRRGTPFLLADADTDRLPGELVRRRARKYVRGAHRPRIGDLAYTEFTIFGP